MGAPARAFYWLLLALCAWQADRFRGQAQGHFAGTRQYEDIYYLPPPNYLIAGSLGYRETVADLVWMKGLIYFGEEIVHRGGVSNLYRYTDAMLALDPSFKKVYRWVASTSIYRTGNVDTGDIYKAIGYLERGIRVFPDDGELAWDLGATYTFELAPLIKDPDERATIKRRGLAHLEVAVLRGAGPPWLVLQTASQLDHLGQTEQAMRHLQDVYATISDPVVKRSVLNRIARLRSSAYAEALERTNAELEAARAKDFPYLPTTLYMLVGRRPPIDGNAMRRRSFDPLDLPTESASDDAEPN